MVLGDIPHKTRFLTRNYKLPGRYKVDELIVIVYFDTLMGEGGGGGEVELISHKIR